MAITSNSTTISAQEAWRRRSKGSSSSGSVGVVVWSRIACVGRCLGVGAALVMADDLHAVAEGAVVRFDQIPPARVVPQMGSARHTVGFRAERFACYGPDRGADHQISVT